MTTTKTVLRSKKSTPVTTPTAPSAERVAALLASRPTSPVAPVRPDLPKDVDVALDAETAIKVTFSKNPYKGTVEAKVAVGKTVIEHFDCEPDSSYGMHADVYSVSKTVLDRELTAAEQATVAQVTADAAKAAADSSTAYLAYDAASMAHSDAENAYAAATDQWIASMSDAELVAVMLQIFPNPYSDPDNVGKCWDQICECPFTPGRHNVRYLKPCQYC